MRRTLIALTLVVAFATSFGSGWLAWNSSHDSVTSDPLASGAPELPMPGTTKPRPTAVPIDADLLAHTTEQMDKVMRAEMPNAFVCRNPQGDRVGMVDLNRPPGSPSVSAIEKKVACEKWLGVGATVG